MSKYIVEVTQVTTVEVEAETEELAVEAAYSTYLDHAADSVDAKVVSDGADD